MTTPSTTPITPTTPTTPTKHPILQTPITTLFAALAIVATLARLTHYPVDFLYTTSVDTPYQPWRFLLSIFPHVNVYHIAFNIYWLWKLGTPLEPRLGRLRYLAFLILFAVTSSAAEFAFLQGGIGLSGVVYGIFGLRWILHRRHSPLDPGPMPHNTVPLFIVWFFACIGLTIANILPVGNIAHGIGAITGISVAFLLTTPPAKRKPLTAALAAFTLLLFLLAFPFRPLVNFSAEPAGEYTYAAYLALQADRNEEGLTLLQHAIRYRKVDAYTWYLLGVTHERLGQDSAALLNYRHALDLQDNIDYRHALQDLQSHLAYPATTTTNPATTSNTAPTTTHPTTLPE